MTPDEVFEKALSFTLSAEGGFSNDPSDSGGKTQCGITQHTYDSWLAEKSMPSAPVEQISAQEIRQLYRDEYWDSAKLDEFITFGCSAKAAICVFDCCVNTGVNRSVKLLQATVDAPTDGIMGLETMGAVLAYQPSEDALISQLLARRRMYYNALATQNKADQKFLQGWLNRVDHLEAYVKDIA